MMAGDRLGAEVGAKVTASIMTGKGAAHVRG